jgi:catechol 2,3-dioxygenase
VSLTRIGYANLHVTDLASAIAHYTEIVGLRLVEREGAGRAYLQSADNQDHHCLVLNETGRAGLDHLGYKVNDPEDLVTVARDLSARGTRTSRVPDGALRGQGEGLRFTAPSGHDFVLYFHAEKIGYAGGMKDPDVVEPLLRGGATHLDHAVIVCERPAEMRAFMAEVLGFYVTEQGVDPGGAELVIFLTCSNKMHDLAIAPGENGRLHHLAFGLESRHGVIARTDLLKQRRVPTLELGVTRHGIAGVTTVYFHDPSGNRNEFYHGAYTAAGIGGRVPTVDWNLATSERALFYYEGAVPGNFLSTVT